MPKKEKGKQIKYPSFDALAAVLPIQLKEQSIKSMDIFNKQTLI